MNWEPTYKAAQQVAGTVVNRFAEMHALAPEEEPAASVPSVAQAEELIDTCFWASLRREEGYSPKISLAFLQPEAAEGAMLFEHHLPLTPAVLAKLSPGVERPGIHVGVWPKNGRLCLWGTTRSIPGRCFVLDVSEPGLLVIKYRRSNGFGKFANLAVLKGDQIRIVDEKCAGMRGCPDLLSSLVAFTSAPKTSGAVNVLVQLAVSMRAHQRGGTLLVVPATQHAWQHSIVHPMPYPIQPAYSKLAELIEDGAAQENQEWWQGEIARAVDGLAGLTAIDGATIINNRYELLSFGAKIGRPEGSAPVEQIILSEPIIGNEAVTMHPALNGGTRHLSAAQFVHDQRDALALVASQDGKFTVFSWSACDGIVHAYRVDALLL